MVNVHLHIVGTKDGVQCLPSHIPGAKVHIEGYADILCYSRFSQDFIADESGVVNFPLSNTCFNLSIGATTPKGRHGEMRQSGSFGIIETNVTWVLGVPGACDEGSALADARAAAGGVADLVWLALLLGGAVVAGYVIVKYVGGRKRGR